MDTVKSAVAEHAHIPGSSHFVRFDKASVLAREKFFVPRKVREAIEICRYPNFNRDCGWNIPPAWKTVLNICDSNIVRLDRETDTVSVVCHQPYFTNNSDSDSEISDSSDGDLTNTAEPGQTAPSQRQLRAEARARRFAQS